MPIEYKIITREGSEFSLNSTDTEAVRHGSMTQGPDQLRLNYIRIEGKSVPGVIALGPSKVSKREIKLTITLADPDQDVYSLQVNKIMGACNEAEKLAANFATARVRCTRVGVKYGKGQLKKGVGEIEASFDFLDPYWEIFPPTVYRFKVSAGKLEPINDTRDRLIPIGAKVQLDASGGRINKFVFFRGDTNEGIKIIDPHFGRSVQENIYTIDCRAGTALLGDRSRLEYIAAGSGFFNMPLSKGKMYIYNSGPGDLIGTLTQPELIYV